MTQADRRMKTPRDKQILISTTPDLGVYTPKLLPKLTAGSTAPRGGGTPSLMGGITKEPGGFHKCSMCGSHFLNLFNYHRHILRQHWFETQKQFSEEHFQFKKIDGLTEKQCGKLRELYRKLKDRNSPTPPKRSRRSRPYGTSAADHHSNGNTTNGARVSHLKEYKLVTVDDMSDAYKDKYHNPGGYTIFHFKVPKKNCTATPSLTALKKTYSSGDKKIPQKTEKVPITDSQPLSSWHQKTFQSHLSHSLATSSSSASAATVGGPLQLTTSSGPRHSGCGKCSKRGCKNRCKKTSSSSSSSGKLPLHFSSPLVKDTPISCTDILQKIVHSPESIQKPQISLTVEDREAKVDVVTVDLAPYHPSNSNGPSSSSSSNGSTDLSSEIIEFFLPSDPTAVLAQIGLEMVYRQYVQPPT